MREWARLKIVYTCILLAVGIPVLAIIIKGNPQSEQSKVVLKEHEGAALVQKSDCAGCHQLDAKTVGPSFKDISQKYTSEDIPALAAKIKNGSSGTWGAIPMPPHPAETDPNLEKMVGWIISLNSPEAAEASVDGKSGATLKSGSHAAYRSLGFVNSRNIVWVIAQLHLLFGAFVLAVPMFALIIEFIGFKTKQKKFDRLSYEFTKLLSVSFSFTASLGALLTLLLIYLYPQLMNYMAYVFGPTFLPYVLLFFGEAFFLYSYYYGWGKFHPVVHLLLGLGLNASGIGILFVADSWLTFMNSPNGVTETGELVSTWAAVQNFTWMPMNIHRTIGNIAFGGAIAGAYGAYRFLGAKTEEEKAYYDWMGYIGNFIAISAFLPLPFAGYWLGKEIYDYSQNLGMFLMGGAFSWLFIIQAILIGMLFVAANYYLWLGMERIEGADRFKKHVKWLLLSVIVCFIVWAIPHSMVASIEEAQKMGGGHHPLLSVLGVMSAKNTAVNILILTTFLSFLLYRRGNKKSLAPWVNKGNWAQILILTATSLYVIWLGIYGYFVEADVRIGLSIPQVGSVLLAMFLVVIIDIFMFRRSMSKEINWGKMPKRAQYVLFFIALSFTWIMGLMGYARAGMRQHWHVYGVIEDKSPDAYTPTLGYAANVTSITVMIFFGFIAVVFWLTSLSHKKDYPSHFVDKK